MFSPRAAITAVDIPAQPAPRGDLVRRLYAGHEPDRFRLEDSHAVKFTQMEQHSRVASQIRRREKQTRMTRHAAHMLRCGIMHDTAPWLTLHNFSRRNAGQLALRRQIACIQHLKGLENLLRYEILERHFAHAM